MNHGADVRLVDAHTERDGRDDHFQPAFEKCLLHLLAAPAIEPRVIGRDGRSSAADRAPGFRNPCAAACRRSRAAGPSILQESPQPAPKRRIRRGLHHLDRDVVAPEAVDEMLRRESGPVACAMSFCTSGVAVAVSAITGAGRKRRQMLADGAVVGPEIVTPLRNAVRLVDRDQARLALRQHLREPPHPQPLRRDEQKVELAFKIVGMQTSRRGRPVAVGVDPIGRETQAPASSPPDLPSARSAG